MTRVLLVPVAVAVAVACAACGGAEALSKDEYEARLRPIVLALGPRLGRMHATIGDRTRLEDVEREVRLGRRALEDAARRLEAIEPPDDVERMHDGIASAAHQYARELEPLFAAARCRDEKAVELAAARRSTAALAAIDTAILAMRRRSYRIPKLSGGPLAPARTSGPGSPPPADCAERT